MHLNEGLSHPPMQAKRYETSVLSSLVRKLLMQSSAGGLILDLRLRDFEDFTNGRVVSVARPLYRSADLTKKV